ncbi:MAG: polyphenol oxidase family protein, partial [Gemmatimonadaceae bacterium]
MSHGLIEEVPGFASLGIVAFTTTRAAGDFGLTSSNDSSAEVFNRWLSVGALAGIGPERIACAHQVHGGTVLVHRGGWGGFLRHTDADGHFSQVRQTLMAVTLADCVPVFVAHASGACAVLHSGWKGTVANITRAGIQHFIDAGLAASDLMVHCGPAICGRCYEVGPEVFMRLTGRSVERPNPVDLRAIIAGQAFSAGVRNVSVSE